MGAVKRYWEEAAQAECGEVTAASLERVKGMVEAELKAIMPKGVRTMANKSVWNGTVGFGLVSIPMSVHAASAEDEKGIKFCQLCSQCGTRIKQPKTCPNHGALTEKGSIVKGYEVGKDSYIRVEETDLANAAALRVRSTRSIDFSVFVPAAPFLNTMLPFLDAPYYMGAGKGGEKAYHLLLQAMSLENVVGIGKVAFKMGKEHLCVVKPDDGYLTLFTMRWGDEVRSPDEIRPRAIALSEKEITLGRTLVQSMMGEFDPKKYIDEYRVAVESILSDLIMGKKPEVVAVPEAKVTGEVDLVAMLTASIGKK